MMKVARYIEERRVSLMVSVSLIVQIIERPLTATRAASNPINRIADAGQVPVETAGEQRHEEQRQDADGDGQPELVHVETRRPASRRR